MGKTDVTREIEEELFKYFFLKKSMRCAFEVECPKLKVVTGSTGKKFEMYWWNGRVDFIAAHGTEFTFIEIKVSFSDFKSDNGHNLVGHKNYYAVSDDIADRVMDLIPAHVGLYVWNGQKLECRKKCKRVKEPLYLKASEHYGKTQTEMIMHNILTACNSTINRLLKENRSYRTGE